MVEELSIEASSEPVKKLDGFKVLLRGIDKRVSKDYDAVIAVTGPEGVGKSRCAIKIAQALDPNFDFTKNILFQPSANELINKVKSSQRGAAIVVDEAIQILYKLEWQSKGTIKLDKFFKICREYGVIVILCMPKFTDFNRNIRGGRAALWIHVHDRGQAIVFQQSDNPVLIDPYRLNELQRAFDKAFLRCRSPHITPNVIEQIKKTMMDTYLMSFTFDDFPKEEKKLYKDLKLEASKIKLEEDTMEEGTTARMFYRILGAMHMMGACSSNIAAFLRISVDNIDSRMSRGVIDLINDPVAYTGLLQSSREVNVKMKWMEREGFPINDAAIASSDLGVIKSRYRKDGKTQTDRLLRAVMSQKTPTPTVAGEVAGASNIAAVPVIPPSEPHPDYPKVKRPKFNPFKPSIGGGPSE